MRWLPRPTPADYPQPSFTVRSFTISPPIHPDVLTDRTVLPLPCGSRSGLSWQDDMLVSGVAPGDTATCRCLQLPAGRPGPLQRRPQEGELPRRSAEPARRVGTDMSRSGDRAGNAAADVANRARRPKVTADFPARGGAHRRDGVIHPWPDHRTCAAAALRIRPQIQVSELRSRQRARPHRWPARRQARKRSIRVEPGRCATSTRHRGGNGPARAGGAGTLRGTGIRSRSPSGHV